LIKEVGQEILNRRRSTAGERGIEKAVEAMIVKLRSAKTTKRGNLGYFLFFESAF
jgi:hypothetical protein